MKTTILEFLKEENEFSDSKIIDTDGNLLILYHGTETKFSTFDISKQKNGWLGKGFYFTDDLESTKEYGNIILKVYLNIRNPFIVSGNSPSDVLTEVKNKYHNDDNLFNDDISILLKKYNHDGIIFNHWDKGLMISCFYPNQIKIIN